MHRRTLLLAAASVAPLVSPVCAQPASVRFNFDSEFGRARDMGKELQTRIARIGLLLFSDAMIRARIAQKPFGYEDGAEFRSAVSEMQATLTKILEGTTAEIGVPLSVPGEAASLMASRYKDNEGKIPTFLIDIRKPAVPLRALPDVDILRYQLWTSTLVAARDPKVWGVAWKFTGFFPFC